MHLQLGQTINNKTQKGQNLAVTWEVLGAKQGPTHGPCTQHHKGVGRPPKRPLRPDPPIWTTIPTPPHLRDQPAIGSKGTCYLLLLPCAVAGVPVKPYLKFLSTLSSISTDGNKGLDSGAEMATCKPFWKLLVRLQPGPNSEFRGEEIHTISQEEDSERICKGVNAVSGWRFGEFNASNLSKHFSAQYSRFHSAELIPGIQRAFWHSVSVFPGRTCFREPCRAGAGRKDEVLGLLSSQSCSTLTCLVYWGSPCSFVWKKFCHQKTFNKFSLWMYSDQQEELT